jgi:hypothetical protein
MLTLKFKSADHEIWQLVVVCPTKSAVKFSAKSAGRKNPK